MYVLPMEDTSGASEPLSLSIVRVMSCEIKGRKKQIHLSLYAVTDNYLHYIMFT